VGESGVSVATCERESALGLVSSRRHTDELRWPGGCSARDKQPRAGMPTCVGYAYLTIAGVSCLSRFLQKAPAAPLRVIRHADALCTAASHPLSVLCIGIHIYLVLR